MNSTTALPRRDNYLDALRGIAILGVVAVHISLYVYDIPRSLWQFMYNGRYGVQLFFVVSAFTLSQSAAHATEGRLNVRHFFIRRLFRILPAYWLAIGIYLLINITRLPADWPQRIAASALFLNYARHDWVQTGFPPGGWSIVAEMIFYLLFPFLYRALKGPRAALAAVGLSLGLSLAAYACIHSKGSWAPPHLPDWFRALADDEYGFIHHLPVFLCGILAFRLGKRAPRSRAAFTMIALLVAVSFAGNIVPDNLRIAYFGMASALLLKFLQNADARSPLLCKPMARLGEISFSVYLFHFAVIDILAGLWPWPLGGLGMVALYAMAVYAVSIAVASVCYAYVEKPFIALSHRLTAGAISERAPVQGGGVSS